MKRYASQLLLVSVSFHGPALWISEGGFRGDATSCAGPWKDALLSCFSCPYLFMVLRCGSAKGFWADATRRAAAARRRSPPPPPEVCSMAAVAAATAHHAVIFITLKYFFYYIIKIVCFGVLHCNAPQWWPRRRPTPYSLSYLLYYNFYYIIKTVVAATAAYMLLFTTASTSLQFGAAKRRTMKRYHKDRSIKIS